LFSSCSINPQSNTFIFFYNSIVVQQIMSFFPLWALWITVLIKLPPLREERLSHLLHCTGSYRPPQGLLCSRREPDEQTKCTECVRPGCSKKNASAATMELWHLSELRTARGLLNYMGPSPSVSHSMFLNSLPAPVLAHALQLPSAQCLHTQQLCDGGMTWTGNWE
jgi:hypothetical protein